jgi:DNA-binding NtrC family response regulator
MSIPVDNVLAENFMAYSLGAVLRRIQNQRIVIVEDDDMIKDSLQSYFQDHNEVATFANAEEAISAQDSYAEANVFIIDYHLPGKDGVVLFQSLRHRFSKARFILITGEMNYELADNTRKLGLDALILKPFDFTILENNISTLVAAA